MKRPPAPPSKWSNASPEPVFLGIDIGTSSVKAIIVDDEDNEFASAAAPLQVDRPQPLWSEQHPGDWWKATSAVLDELATSVPRYMEAVAAVGLSGQMLGVTLV